MIGTGYDRRENLWAGVGHAENTGLDYLIISIRNLGFQFGDEYPQHLVRQLTYNGQSNPGRLEDDGGLSIYPRRTFKKPLPGVKEWVAHTSFYEQDQNHFLLRFNFVNGAYDLKSFKESDIQILGDGEIRVHLKRL
jgi:hypothetical protein